MAAAREQRYGLLLGIANQVLRGAHRYRQPIYWATVEDDAADAAAADEASLIGCAFRTPPHQVGVTELPAAAIDPLVASLRETYLNLPGVAGPEATATAFAGLGRLGSPASGGSSSASGCIR